MSHRIDIVPVDTPDALRAFVELPYQLYKGNTCWVPPLRSDERNALLPRTNPALDFCDFRMWIARRDGRCVGRIAAIVNHRWIDKNDGRRCGRLSRYDCIDDIEVSGQLFATAEAWLRSCGMTEVQGPMGFTNLDHQGVLIEGFDRLPSVGSEYSLPYYHTHFERAGYTKVMDWLEFRITFPAELPEKSFRVADGIARRYNLHVSSYSTKAQLQAVADDIFRLFNEAFSRLFGAYEFPDRLMRFYIDKYMPILVPRYVKTVEDRDGRMAGFIIALPSLSRAMQRARGRLWPLGWWHIMRALRRPTEIDLLLTGVRPELQRMGVAALLMNELWRTAAADGVRFVETTGMLEDNHVALQMWKSFDHEQHKRKRCYGKSLG